MLKHRSQGYSEVLRGGQAEGGVNPGSRPSPFSPLHFGAGQVISAMQQHVGFTAGIRQQAPSSPISPSKNEELKTFFRRSQAKRSQVRAAQPGNGSYLRWGPIAARHAWTGCPGSAACRRGPQQAPVAASTSFPHPVHLSVGAGGGLATVVGLCWGVFSGWL